MQKARQDRMFLFLAVMSIASTMGFQVWRTLFNNFAVEVVGLEGNHIGIIQSIREIPGFLALLVVFVTLVIKEHRLSALSVAILGLGISLTGVFPSFTGLIFTTLLMSFGFHYFETTNQSLTLQYFDRHTSPWVMGKLRSYSSASAIIIGFILLGASSILSYELMFGILGGLIVLAGIWGMFLNPTRLDLVPQQKKMIFRKRYSLYYFLTFMAGARRQIFMAFAVFLLVEKFHFSVKEITILFMLNNAINYFLSPLIGKAIIRFGEQKVLSTEYLSLIFIFIAYATVESKSLMAALYILDHIFFNFSMAIRTYFQKVGDADHMAPTMAMGFTINHIAAVAIPVLGGLAWIIDYRIPFIAGAVMSLVSLIAVQYISKSILKAEIRHNALSI
ncbi:MAG: MFS transporter [Candidatus Marinimicrobia bacterium]|nr:MFS transporter [Candidatus Neomarinimicrobiota bacterium]MCF7922753.1 MFS transporter [Candidatus Neomarinimicrobiota bacterium]